MFKKFYQKYGYLILFAYVIAAYFYMPLGIIAVICMFAPIVFALLGKGRYWCGHFCPRGNFYQNIVGKMTRKHKAPAFLKSIWFRVFMVFFIIGNFSLGLYKNWGNAAGIGMVFYRIILITTVVGIVLGALYQPRTWCGFCPMGSIATFVTWIQKRKASHSR